MGKELLGSLELNRIYQMDCLEGMKLIPNKSIDAIICDPPYGTTAQKWDSIIPFDKLWDQYKRIIKDHCSILLFGSEPFSTHLRMSNIDMYRYDWYWVKSKPGLYQHAKNRPMKAVETVSVFSNSKWGHKSQVTNRMNYFPQGIKPSGKKVVNKNYNAGGIVGERPNQIGKEYMSYTGFPNDVLHYANVIGRKALHPTQKPVDLVEYLIKTYTNEGDIILDNCMGSGTTAVAATLNNRKWIGFETETKYIELANKRLDNIQLEDDITKY